MILGVEAFLFTLLASYFPHVLAEVTQILTPDNFDGKVGTSVPAFVEFYAPWCGHCKKLAPEWEKLATTFQKASVVVGKVDCDSHKDLCSKFDVKGYPTIKWFDADSKKPEDYNGGREADDLIEFLNGKLGTNFRTVAPPSYTTVLTQENFDSIALNPEKNVLVEFYAPWCGHCKQLAPVYDELAAAFKNEPSVVIAKVDADTHKDLGERYEVTGFPTIKWFPTTSKIPNDYDGGRSLEDFVKFINKEAGTARTSSGSLNNKAGRISALDAVSSTYTTSADKAVVLSEVEQAATALAADDKSGSAARYLKVVKNLREKGEGYISTETARLDRMLSGSLKPEKVDDISIRKNILSAFLPPPPEAPEDLEEMLPDEGEYGEEEYTD